MRMLPRMRSMTRRKERRPRRVAFLQETLFFKTIKIKNELFSPFWEGGSSGEERGIAGKTGMNKETRCSRKTRIENGAKKKKNRKAGTKTPSQKKKKQDHVHPNTSPSTCNIPQQNYINNKPPLFMSQHTHYSYKHHGGP